MTDAEFIPLQFVTRDESEIADRARAFRDLMRARRSVRDFAPRAVAQNIIADCVATAAAAPSGANQQPWTFVCISDPAVKKQIRLGAEAEEREFYAGKAGTEWLSALEQLGTDWQKPFLEIAPWLIVVFAQRHGIDAAGNRIKHYYVPESVGIATGILVAALHNAGLATLTHTPAPMGFLNRICGRGAAEKPLAIVVTGYPRENCQVPRIEKKPLEDVAVWL